MKKIIASNVFLIFFLTFSAFGQEEQPTQKWFKSLNIGLNAGAGFMGDLSWQHVYGLGNSQKFRIGYGVRLNVYGGSDLDYTSAPPDYQDEAQKDTVTLASSGLTSLNLGIYTEYHFSPKVLIGFNIDAVGVSFGAEQEGTLVSDGVGQRTKATPTTTNILLVGANDMGSLNSNFYAGFRVSEKITLKAGMAMYFGEYTTEIPQPNTDNDRFRVISQMGFVGVGIQL